MSVTAVAESAPRRLLGPVHRHVRFLEQRLCVFTIGRVATDPYAGGDEEVVAVEAERLREAVQDFSRDARDCIRCGDFREEDAELIAADPRYAIDALTSRSR